MRALALEPLRSDSIGVFGEVLEERGIVDRVMLDHALLAARRRRRRPAGRGAARGKAVWVDVKGMRFMRRCAR